jgi:gliding motility-associated-like protein
MRRIILGLIVIASFLSVQGQEVNDVWMHPNRGQWESEILYKIELGQGAMYVEKDGFTFDLHNLGEVIGHHHDDAQHKHEHDPDEVVQRHAIFLKFENSSWSGTYKEDRLSSFYRSYFLGQDSSKWASQVYAIQYLRLHDFYPNIDLIVETKSDAIKYSFEVRPGGDASKIRAKYTGADGLALDANEELVIHTRFGPFYDKNLSVWTVNEEGRTRSVKSAFELNGDLVSVLLPEGYDTTQLLVIDPELTFSSFTGSTADNWGFTAAPDQNANLFGGGIVFGSGYPITAGAYDATFNGGEGTFNIDIGISKFNAQGTALLYSTYVGGNRNETPNSIVANDQNELYVLGVTSSTNFPLAGTPVQPAFAGGTLTTQNALQFSGTDLIIFKLNAAGTALLGGTYLGGSANDGLNLSPLNYNYGDQFRGEIIVDDASNVYIASSTRSSNFPTPNGFDNTLGGSQDAVVAKFSPNLNTLFWSSYFGGSMDETGFAVQISSVGNVYLTGGTSSPSLGFSNGHINNFIGGISDGYIVQLNGNTSAPISGTYVGTNAYDQNYFVQLDLDDNVYVFGQSRGNMPISPGLYANPNSGQFIRKYNTALNTVEWNTVVGGGSGNIEISPTAFLVSDCDEIYYAGWGGQTNQSSQATQSSTVGFPTTPDAFQQNTNGNNFYVAVLGENATTLNYASYMGGVTSSANHVDGGTSRFDKKGRIYHAVCGGCGGNANGFTTTPGVVSPQNQSNNCNLAAFKFDLGIIEAAISAPDPFICIPDPVNFINNSSNANSFLWLFGDGNSSTDFEPSHFYTQPGTYVVTLIATDTIGCYEADSSLVEVVIGLFDGAVVQPPNPVCPGEAYQLEASGGSVYAWTPAQFLDDSTSATPIAMVDQTTVFTVIISDSCGTDTLLVTLDVYGASANSIDDFSICLGDTVELWAAGGGTYQWSPSAEILTDPTQASVLIAPQQTTDYLVEIITPEGCELVREITVSVFNDVPIPVLDDTVRVCRGDAVTISTSGATEYFWYPDLFINTTTGPVVTIETNIDFTYYVDYTNACGTVTDSIHVALIDVDAIAGNDTIVCPGEVVHLFASGGVSYLWSPAESVFNPNASNTSALPPHPTTYSVLVTDENGCSAAVQVFVDHFPLPFVQTSPDYYGFQGDEVNLTANGTSSNGTYTWSPTEYLSCVNCQSPTSFTQETITYVVDYVDENGCTASDDVTIFFEGIIYLPNTFTPDGNKFNETFFAKGGNIVEFNIQIFNRWGELIFEGFDFNDHWDGTYNGQPCQDGTYVWKVKFKDVMDNEKLLVGHVNLLR